MSVIQRIKGPRRPRKDLQFLKTRLKKRMEDPSQPPEKKKRFPGGVILFLLAIVLVILAFQNLSSKKQGNISFSHQIEHLVNLDLIRPEESRKTAQNENLVTFNGKFKERLSDEAKARYRYLELLNQNQDYLEGKKEIENNLTTLKKGVEEAAKRFLFLSGLPVSKEGYTVVSSAYDTKGQENQVIISKPEKESPINLSLMEKQLQKLKMGASDAEIREFGLATKHLVEDFRSPVLGIGNQKMKETLSKVSRKLEGELNSNTISSKEMLRSSGFALAELRQIVGNLNEKQEQVRLFQLRSVRNYLIDIEQYRVLVGGLEENNVELKKARESVLNVTWFFNNRELSTKTLEKQSPEEFSLWFAQAKKEWQGFSSNKGMAFKAPDQPRNLVLEKTFQSQSPSPNYLSYIFLTIFPVVLVILLLYFIFSRQMKGMGSSAMNFGKSPAKMLNKSIHKVTFKDVAGIEEAKEELQELVDFLKDPAKFTVLGARIPKGVLLIGSPGTGKTLIAKAVAGEADRPFFSISGSDFVEMFVGVGASRIRDLFLKAKENAPCIVFIDEIDAVGRHRGAGIGGGHDEREQTLNQLLVEMDGFDTNDGVILIAATNRPDVLDRALLRPGRFDRQVMIDLPDIKGRLAILKVHAQKIKLDESVELMDVARATPGTSGADLMNILNEAALLAARKGRSAVTRQDTLEACEKVLYGKERKSLELDQKEKTHTAYHEAGHAVVGLSVERADPVEKVTIIPRGLSLGATHFVPEKNKVSYWKKELIDRLAVSMGGRVAEDIFIGDISSGAQMDISQATSLARNMVCRWGMTDSLGPVAYDERSEEGQYFLPGQNSKSYSEETARQIDDEVRLLLDQANERAIEIITKHKEQLKLMAEMLLEFESLDKEDVQAIMDGSWDAEKKRKKIRNISDAQRKTPPPPKDTESLEKKGDGDIDPSPQEA